MYRVFQYKVSPLQCYPHAIGTFSTETTCMCCCFKAAHSGCIEKASKTIQTVFQFKKLNNKFKVEKQIPKHCVSIIELRAYFQAPFSEPESPSSVFPSFSSFSSSPDRIAPINSKYFLTIDGQLTTSVIGLCVSPSSAIDGPNVLLI